jgi:hypothetical protein
LAVCETNPVSPEGLATGVNVVYAAGMLSPSAAHPVPVPRMVSRLVSVAAEHQVVPAALLTAPVIAAIIVNELYCDIAEANAVGNAFSP